MLSILLALLPSSTSHRHPSSDSSLDELPCAGLSTHPGVSGLSCSLLLACVAFPQSLLSFSAVEKPPWAAFVVVCVGTSLSEVIKGQFREHEASGASLPSHGLRSPSPRCDVHRKGLTNACASPCSASSLYVNCLAWGCSCRKAVKASAPPVSAGSSLGCLVRDATTADWAVVSSDKTLTSPLVTQYCFVYMDLLSRVQLDEQTAFGVGFLITGDLSQKTATCCQSSQSEILDLYVFNLYFIKPCKYMCKSRALSSKSGVLQGFSRFSVAALGSCHGYHGYH